jgi:CubicO group peptidase (beta-lactamase class C family)
MTRRLYVKLAMVALITSCLAIATQASAASWLDPQYLYRYFVWGIPTELDKSNQFKWFPSRPIQNGSYKFQFAPGHAEAVPAVVEYQEGDSVKRAALGDLLRSTDTHAFIVVRDDQVLYENYFNGYRRDSLNESWSMAKSFVSALVGIAIGEGAIKSIDDPITDYLPELKAQQGFDAITIRNLLTMGSGIRYRFALFPWDEFVLAGFYPDLRELLLTDMKIVEPPGKTFHYNNFNTELLGMILERATHRALSEYLEEKIWQPLGMEYPAEWSLDHEPNGLELSATLLNARAIDFGKFGRLFLNEGNWNGRQIVPHNWAVDSTTRDPADNRDWETFRRWRNFGGYYKYFWWGVSLGGGDYEYLANGTYGQFIFISPRTRVVIVRTAGEDGIDPPYWREVFHCIAEHVNQSAALKHDPSIGTE